MGIRAFGVAVLFVVMAAAHGDGIRQLQSEAIANRRCEVVHWGPRAELYSSWTSHSNRLIPVYTFGTKGGGDGVDLESYTGKNSLYRDQTRIEQLYKSGIDDSVDPEAEYLDQTNIFDLQRAALAAGRKHIFLVVFDGMDWQTTRAASIANLGRVAYAEGRGTGTHFQDYQANGTTQFGWMVTSPYRDGVQVDIDAQRIKNPGGGLAGGYSSRIAGRFPWSEPTSLEYLLAGPKQAAVRHAFADSAATATSMCCGIKTYNDVIGIDSQGRPVPSIAHLAQAEGYKVGAVTSVPISHATPASAYAHNVSRDDFQDLSRDLVGLPSVSHPQAPLPGLDVLIGCGFGVEVSKDKNQGANFVAGNQYLTAADRQKIDVKNGGRYVVAERSSGHKGSEVLQAASRQARQENLRLFGFFGVHGQGKYSSANLPLATADGQYDPVAGVDGHSVEYTAADLAENPTLAEMTTAALAVLGANDTPFWLMVEPGDVDWSNHNNNLDDSIGAVNTGDHAVRVITAWVETHSNWNESLLIVTADHGHLLVIDDPEALARISGAGKTATND